MKTRRWGDFEDAVIGTRAGGAGHRAGGRHDPGVRLIAGGRGFRRAGNIVHAGGKGVAAGRQVPGHWVIAIS